MTMTTSSNHATGDPPSYFVLQDTGIVFPYTNNAAGAETIEIREPVGDQDSSCVQCAIERQNVILLPQALGESLQGDEES